jgi:hypothetical protein
MASLVGAFMSLFLGWTEWRANAETAQLATWRLVVRRITLLAVSAQFLFFAALWSPLARYPRLILSVPLIEAALFFLAAPCAILGSMQRRWWLLASSVIFPIVSFFVVLAETAY